MTTKPFDFSNEVEQVATLPGGKPVLRMNYKAKLAFAKSAGFTPFKAQKQVAKSFARTRTLCAGARFGKSVMVTMEAAPELLRPDFRMCIIGEEYNLAAKEFEYIWNATVEHPNPHFRDFINANIENKANNPKMGNMWIKFKWGSLVVCKSTMKPTSLLGDEWDMVILAEGSQIPKWIIDKYVWQRLSSRMGQLFIPTTPNGFDDMLYPRFLKGQNKDNHYSGDNYPNSFESWEFRSIDNPYYDKRNYYIAQEAVEAGDMSEADFGEQFEGKFTSNTGLVYKNFNTRVHVVEPYICPDTWPLVCAIDVGMDAPTVCLFARIDQTGAIVIEDEYYKDGVDVQEHCKNIRDKVAGREVIYTVIDPASSQRTASNVKSALDQYIENGIPCIAADNSVDAGIMRVTEYLRFSKDKEHKVTEAPKLFIFNKCGNLIEEFGKYVWSRSRKDGAKTNKPVKRDDHGIDALRYLCMSRPYYPRHKTTERLDPDSFEYLLHRNKRQKNKLPDLGYAI